MKTSNRQQWVDTAKGVCILLVILYHIIEHFKPNTQLTQFDSFLYSIRMPLYYRIAGLFVVVHNIKGFYKKIKQISSFYTKNVKPRYFNYRRNNKR